MPIANVGAIHSPFPLGHTRNVLMERLMKNESCRTRRWSWHYLAHQKSTQGISANRRHRRAGGMGRWAGDMPHCPVGLGLSLQELFPTVDLFL